MEHKSGQESIQTKVGLGYLTRG